MAHDIRCAVSVLAFVVLITAQFQAGVAGVQETKPGHIKVLIEKIRYEGGDLYSVVISVSNFSSHDVLVRIIDDGFFIQTDRGWAQLKAPGNNRESREFSLPANGNAERPAVISIPLSIPELFRTYEGDLSLMYRYSYALWAADKTGTAINTTDEIYCWIKPGTSQWHLREGM